HRYVVGTGTTLAVAKDDLKRQGRRHVDLFVLDMYFPNEGMNTPAELSKLGKGWDKFCSAEDDLKKVLTELGQSFAGGRALARQITSRSAVGVVRCFSRSDNRRPIISFSTFHLRSSSWPSVNSPSSNPASADRIR